MRYWLIKSEPDVYSYADLERDGRTFWDGVRNYQARNLLRDDLKVGDLALYYHSNADPTGIVGYCRVVREGYPDHTQFEPEHDHFDATAKKEEPRWFMVDVEPVAAFPEILSLERLKADPALEGMLVLRKGQRLSVMPVDEAHFRHVLALAGL